MINTEILLGNIKLNKRIIAEPVVSGKIDLSGYVNRSVLDHYTNIAKSNASIVVIEQQAVSFLGRNSLKQLSFETDESALDIKKITDIFKKEKIPVIGQLNFSGAGASGIELIAEDSFKLLSPSGLRTPRDLIRHDSIEISRSEIGQAISDFKVAALRAINISEYDGIQIYACHGYLIGQFLSPLTNKRDDEYGGDIQGRAKLLFDIVQSIRDVLPEVNLSIRLSGSDNLPYQKQEGLTIEECCYVAQRLVELKVDWLSISGNHCIYGIGEDDNDTAYFKEYSRKIKVAINNNIPVDLAGGIRTKAKDNELLLNDYCDTIGLGRPLVKDSNFIINNF